MSEEFKQQIIATLQTLHEKIGSTVLIDDWVSTRGRGYDRHYTTYGLQKIKIQKIYIRISGGVATIEGEDQRIEFKTGDIKHIESEANQLIIEMNMIDNVWRRIKICDC